MIRTATLAPATCEHDSARGVALAGDTITSAWECDQCGHLTPFTDADYAFVHTRPWTPRAPEGVSALTWLFTPREDKRAAILAG